MMIRGGRNVDEEVRFAATRFNHVLDRINCIVFAFGPNVFANGKAKL